MSQGLEVHVTTDALPGRVFNGKVSAINSMVDSSTRNVSLQATLENPEHLLRPGMFAKVEVVLPEKHKSIVIPGSAISYAPFGDSVFVIEKKKDREDGQGISDDPATVCAGGRGARRFCFDQRGIEGGRNDRGHRRFQVAQRNVGHDQQRSRSETADESEPVG